MKKVLVITYYWPPGSGAGVQRWLKFARYLPEFGWEPVILTVDPEYASYPATDNTLSNDIPAGIRVFRTKATDYFRFYGKSKGSVPAAGFATGKKEGLKEKAARFIRGNFFIPDPRKGWNRHAYRKACEIINSEGIEHIVTTSPPHSTQLIGLKLKRKFPGIKWIADLRDPWTDIYYYKMFFPTLLSRIYDKYLEKQVMKEAGRITTVGSSLRDHFSAKTEGVREKISVIPNGFDPDDFNEVKREKPTRFTIAYTGTISHHYPLESFLSALSTVKKSGLNFCLSFTGLIPGDISNRLKDIAGEENASFTGYVDHRTAVKSMYGASLLLLIIPDHPGNRCIITGKLFEYIATGVPVLCIGPEDGDAAMIISELGAGRCFNYNQSEEIAEYILEVSQKENLNTRNPEKYSRIKLASELAEILNNF